MVGDVEHPVLKGAGLTRLPGNVDGLGYAQPGGGQVVRRPQPVKFQPYVLPGLLLVGAVGVDLAGADEKPLAGPQAVMMGHPVGVIGAELPPARDDKVKQVVVADRGTVGIEGGTLLPAVLVEGQIEKMVIGEDGKGIIVHHSSLTFTYGFK